MGEVPILTLSAHVFQIDPETKKKWLPSSQQAVNVSFYHDSSRNTYRIICIDDNKVLINCFVMPNMKFTKTAQKFGQWIDNQAATVYGLGFSSENDLVKFADKFEEVKGLSVPPTSGNNRTVKSAEPSVTKPILTGRGKPSDATSSTVTTTSLNNNHQQLHSSGSIGSSSSNEEKTVNKLASQFQRQVVPSGSSGSQVNNNNNSNSNQIAALKQSSVTNEERCNDTKCSNLVSVLRSENDRLKLELAQSSSKTREWEAELQQLRNSNVTLTTALEESRRNADEWQKQLDSYNDEILEARRKLESFDSVTFQLSDARERLKEAERLSSTRQEELIQLRQQFNDSKRIEIQNQKLTTKLRDIEMENGKLKIQLKDLMAQLDQAKLFKKPTNHQRLQLLQEEISSKINELYAMNDQLADELQAYM